MSRYLIFAALAMAAMSGIYGYGYYSGNKACRTATALAVADAQSKAVEAAELASRKEEERLVAEAERRALAAQLEDQAYAENVTAAACLPASRVRRLNQF